MSETNTGKPPEGPVGLKAVVTDWLLGIDAVHRGDLNEFVLEPPLGDTHRNKGVLVTSANAHIVEVNLRARFSPILSDGVEF